MPLAPPLEYRVIETKRGDQMYGEPPGTFRWRSIITELLTGNYLFVPGMSRLEVESLRSIIAYHKYGVLRTRATVENGEEGRLLRLDRSR